MFVAYVVCTVIPVSEMHCAGRSTNELDTAEEGEVITGNILYILDWLGGQQSAAKKKLW